MPVLHKGRPRDSGVAQLPRRIPISTRQVYKMNLHPTTFKQIFILFLIEIFLESSIVVRHLNFLKSRSDVFNFFRVPLASEARPQQEDPGHNLSHPPRPRLRRHTRHQEDGSVSFDVSNCVVNKQTGMEAIERLHFLASFGPPSTGKRKEGEKTQPFNRLHSHLGRGGSIPVFGNSSHQ